jgi:hypothetical protein
MRAKRYRRVPSNCLERLECVWSDLTSHGYALTEEASIGFSGKFRENFRRAYFNDQVLRHDAGDWPVDRKRARDVIRYQWGLESRQLDLAEHETITITDRAGIPGKREHARVMLLNDPQAERLIRSFLTLVPPAQREVDGTLGVNLFRTFTDVVTTPHHDLEKFVIIYMLDRMGDGAESYLYNPDDVNSQGAPTAGPVFKYQLNPGEILIFRDDLFKHGATPVEAPPGGTARRDVLVCTVDNKETYLAAN